MVSRKMTFPGFFIDGVPCLKTTSVRPGQTTTRVRILPSAAKSASVASSRIFRIRSHSLKYLILIAPVLVRGSKCIGMPYPLSLYRHSISVPTCVRILAAYVDPGVLILIKLIMLNIRNMVESGQQMWTAIIRDGTHWMTLFVKAYVREDVINEELPRMDPFPSRSIHAETSPTCIIPFR